MAIEATSEAEKEPEPPEPLKPTIKRRREHTLVTFADDNLNVRFICPLEKYPIVLKMNHRIH